MDDADVLVMVSPEGLATVTLNRPEKHNAFNDLVIARLAKILAELGADGDVRLVALAAQGHSFSAGADLDWMRRAAAYSEAENEADALALARMLRALNTLPKPTVALVQGPAYGGGVGLVAACDIAIALKSAVFAMTEVRLGLEPATVSPYIVAAVGARAARRLFLTGERFDAQEALRLGLVHEVVEDAGALAAARDRVVGRLLDGAPGAQAATKELIAAVTGRPVDDGLLAETARRIAARRVSAEGQEGTAAFLDKRKPAWVRQP